MLQVSRCYRQKTKLLLINGMYSSKYIRKCLIHKWRRFRCDAKVMSGIPCNVTDEKTNTILHSTLLDTQNNCVSGTQFIYCWNSIILHALMPQECLEKTLQILELLNTSLKAFPVIGATHGSGREAVFGRPRQKAMSRTRKKIPGSPIKDFSKSSATEVLLKKGEANIKALHALIMTILSKLSQEGT